MPDDSPHDTGMFPNTLWSMVVDAAHPDDSRAMQALERLGRAYWQPLYVFARQRGAQHHQACDQVQGFFLHLLSKEMLHGLERREVRFRSFLLACFTNWLSNLRRGENAARRGGGAVPLTLDGAAEKEAQAFAVDAHGAEHGYDRRWARAVFDHALARLDGEIAAREGRVEFLHELKRRLLGSAAVNPEWDVVAERFGMSVGAVRKAAHDLRQRFAVLLRHEVRRVVGTDAEVEEELRYLATLLSRDGAGPV